MNTCVHTYTEPQTSSTRSCGLGRRIHGSVEDTKLSTNKQHSPSLQPRIRVRPVPAYRVRSCCVGGRRESERLRAMGAGRRCLAPRVGGGSWSSPVRCGTRLGGLWARGSVSGRAVFPWCGVPGTDCCLPHTHASLRPWLPP